MAAPQIDTAYTEEDCVAFLQRIQEQCPVVLSLLDSKQAKLLSRSPTEAYDPKENINDEYLKDVRCSIAVQQRIEDAKQNLRDTLFMPRKVDREVDVKNFEKQMEVLKMVSSTSCAEILEPCTMMNNVDGCYCLITII